MSKSLLQSKGVLVSLLPGTFKGSCLSIAKVVTKTPMTGPTNASIVALLLHYEATSKGTKQNMAIRRQSSTVNMKFAISQDPAAKIIYGGICKRLMGWRREQKEKRSPMSRLLTTNPLFHKWLQQNSTGGWPLSKQEISTRCD